MDRKHDPPTQSVHVTPPFRLLVARHLRYLAIGVPPYQGKSRHRKAPCDSAEGLGYGNRRCPMRTWVSYIRSSEPPTVQARLPPLRRGTVYNWDTRPYNLYG